jgi:nucleotide-binding universal stress UspA family protein
MYKHVLVPTDGSEFASVGMRYAVAFAKHCGAVIHGLHVIDIKLLEGPFLRDLSSSLGTAPYANYQGNIAMILEERGKAALATLEKTCADAGVRCEVMQATGTVPRMIVEKSALSDVVIMGRGGEHSEWLDGLLGTTTEAVSRRASRPVLVTGTDTPGHSRFLIAYDGSTHARASLQHAAAMAECWKAPLDVLVVGAPTQTALRLEEAKSYFSAHTLQVDYIAKEGVSAEVITQHAKDRNVDLIIMGAFGQSKVLELVLGSTTSYTLNHAPCPVLLVR